MATAKKLPSGSWRVQVLAGYDASGKKIQKSFTDPTKREAEKMADEYKRYKKETLFIISDYSEQIYKAIRETTNHDATLFQGIGCYEEKEKTLIYSVINTEAKRQLIPLIRSIDPHAFINIVKTEELAGRFHDIPND